MTDKYILLGIYENDEPRANVEVLCMSEDLHKVRRIRDKNWEDYEIDGKW